VGLRYCCGISLVSTSCGGPCLFHSTHGLGKVLLGFTRSAGSGSTDKSQVGTGGAPGPRRYQWKWRRSKRANVETNISTGERVRVNMLFTCTALKVGTIEFAAHRMAVREETTTLSWSQCHANLSSSDGWWFPFVDGSSREPEFHHVE
jgi:hypothetical protein